MRKILSVKPEGKKEKPRKNKSEANDPSSKPLSLAFIKKREIFISRHIGCSHVTFYNIHINGIRSMHRDNNWSRTTLF
jgi:hypothetical protein